MNTFLTGNILLINLPVPLVRSDVLCHHLESNINKITNNKVIIFNILTLFRYSILDKSNLLS
ncbi:hypothetical protein SAMN05421882_100394 [Nitrosomonas communis]|uniref:Uncharacterized protein n=1 Tax=Nitrosomonas communis TaxID=44574 RepID=A0A1H2R089_9PROT|nr:hypothetical protein SAMN05421882_100394 [Nitrosomonas communis]